MNQNGKYTQQVDETTLLYYPMDYTPIPPASFWQDHVMEDKVGGINLTLLPIGSGKIPVINHPNGKDTIVNFVNAGTYVSGVSNTIIPDTFVTESQGNWTISGWFYNFGYPTSYTNSGLFGFAGSNQNTAGEQYNTQFSVFCNNSTQQITVRTQHGNSINTNFTTTGSVPVQEWYHLAITKETGSIGDATFKVYINGVLDTVSVISNSTGDLNTTSRLFTIANYSWREGGCDSFMGGIAYWQMDNIVRDSTYVLSASQTYDALIDENTIHLYDMKREPDIKDHGPYGFHLLKEGNGYLIQQCHTEQTFLSKISNNFTTRTISAREMERLSSTGSYYPIKLSEVLTGSWTLELVTKLNNSYRDVNNNTVLFNYGGTSPTSNPSAEYDNTLFCADINNNSLYITHHSGAYTGTAGRLVKKMHTFPSGTVGDSHYIGFTKELIGGGISCSYKMYLNGEYVSEFSCSNCTTVYSEYSQVYLSFFNATFDANRNGQLSEVKLSTDVKTPEHFSKIADLYRKKKIISYGGIVDGEVKYTFTSPPSGSSNTWIANVLTRTSPVLSINTPFEITNVKEQVPGLLAWWKSDTGVNLTGSLVDSWQDQSGNGLHLDLVTATRPTFTGSYSDFNNYPAILFQGNHDLSRAYDSDRKLQYFPNGMTCFAVYKILTGWTTYSSIMGTSDNSSWSVGWSMGNRSGGLGLWFNGWGNYVEKAISVGDVGVSVGRVLETRLSARINKSNVGFANRGTNTAISTTYFSLGKVGLSGFYGQYATPEILIFDRELTYGEVVSVENYLKTKYKI